LDFRLVWVQILSSGKVTAEEAPAGQEHSGTKDDTQRTTLAFIIVPIRFSSQPVLAGWRHADTALPLLLRQLAAFLCQRSLRIEEIRCVELWKAGLKEISSPAIPSQTDETN
jgi:hypothetical protein